VSSGAVLADGSGWTRSHVVSEAGGSLLLMLRHYDIDVLFRLYPATDSFIAVGENRPAAPLDALSEALADSLRTSVDRAKNYLGVRQSPDGSIRVELVAVEWFNTHWVNSPRVIAVATGRVLLDLWNTDWDAVVSFPADRRVAMDMRRYNGQGRFAVSMDTEQDCFEVVVDASGPPIVGPIAGLAAALEDASRRAGQKPR